MWVASESIKPLSRIVHYIAFAIASLVFMIPRAVSTSLFVEGSHGEELKKSTIKSLAVIALLLVPSVVFLYFSGGWFLALIGKGLFSRNRASENFAACKLFCCCM